MKFKILKFKKNGKIDFSGADKIYKEANKALKKMDKDLKKQTKGCYPNLRQATIKMLKNKKA